jgi:hypothetical protein
VTVDCHENLSLNEKVAGWKLQSWQYTKYCGITSNKLTKNESVVRNKLFTEVKLNTSNNAHQYLG